LRESFDDDDMRMEDELDYEVHELEMEGVKLRIKTAEELGPLDAAILMLQLESEKKELSGQFMWEGSRIVCSYIQAHKELVAGKTVLELGAGTGLVSIVAKLVCKAEKVTATDGDKVAMRIIRENLAMNAAAVDAELLRWGEPIQMADVERCDVIVAGDVIYKEELPPLFFQTVKDVLGAKDCSKPRVLYLCHIPRGGVTHEHVQSVATATGLEIVTLSFDLPDDCDNDWGHKANLYQVKILPKED
jgi:predicted nicotinamide N-methyase